MEELFYYYQEDAEQKAEEIRQEYNGTVKYEPSNGLHGSTPMDPKSEYITYNGGASGEFDSLSVYDDKFECVATIIYWTDRDFNLSMSLEKFATSISERTFYPGEIKEVIEYNDWELIPRKDFKFEACERGGDLEELEEGVESVIILDKKNKKRAEINNKGEATVTEYAEE